MLTAGGPTLLAATCAQGPLKDTSWQVKLNKHPTPADSEDPFLKQLFFGRILQSLTLSRAFAVANEQLNGRGLTTYS